MMSRRLRAYIQALGERHLWFAAAIWYAHEVLEMTPAFKFLFLVAWPAWTVLHALIGIAALVARWQRNETLGRATAVVAVVVAAFWASNFLFSFVTDPDAISPLGGLLFAYIARKDFIVLGIPFSPAWDDMLDNTAGSEHQA